MNLAASIALVALLASAPARAEDVAALWRALATGGHVALVRHELAPGVGDPPGMRLEDCRTQRNLSPEGRDRARRLGDAFRVHGIARATVRSSAWCRCADTARLLEIGEVTHLPALDSFFTRPSEREPRTEALRRFVRDQRTGSSVVLVTHDVNVHALTGEAIAPGEIVVVKPLGLAGFRVLGRIPPG